MDSVGLTPGTATAIIGVVAVLYLLLPMAFPSVDPREPPILRPTIPIVGHLVSMIREKTRMFDRLYKEKGLPICTLPIMNGKMYIINKPSLVSAAMRNRALDFEEFSLEFGRFILGIPNELFKALKQPGVTDAFNRVVQSTMTGDKLTRMNIRAMRHIGSELSAVPGGEGQRIGTLMDWCSDTLGTASNLALLGKNNPLTCEDVRLFWEFEQGVPLLAMVPALHIFARRTVQIRNHLQEKLSAFYANLLDYNDDVADVIKGRANLSRQVGFQGGQVSITEMIIPWVAVTNTVPALFWLISHVFSDSTVVSRIREEVAKIVTLTTGQDSRQCASVDMTRLERDCPLLVSCHRESLRVHSDQTFNRRVTTDTTIRDPETGREYLLRKGVHVQWFSIVPHHLPSVWDEDAGFRADRFVTPVSAQMEKARQMSNFPFGGGKHLCPGRNFARVEILGTVAALAVGFEVEGIDGVPKGRPANLGSGFEMPVGGKARPAVGIRRRKGWEDVEWRYSFGLSDQK